MYGLYLLAYKRVRFLSLYSLSGLLVICITSWLNAYSQIKVFSFSNTFVHRFSGLGEDLGF